MTTLGENRSLEKKSLKKNRFGNNEGRLNYDSKGQEVLKGSWNNGKSTKRQIERKARLFKHIWQMNI
jgi:hypothetical protein